MEPSAAPRQSSQGRGGSAPRPIGTLDKLGHERGLAPWTAEVGARLAAGRARAKEAATTEAEAPRPSQQRVPPWAGVPQPEPEPPLAPRAEEGVQHGRARRVPQQHDARAAVGAARRLHERGA